MRFVLPKRWFVREVGTRGWFSTQGRPVSSIQRNLPKLRNTQLSDRNPSVIRPQLLKVLPSGPDLVPLFYLQNFQLPPCSHYCIVTPDHIRSPPMPMYCFLFPCDGVRKSLFRKAVPFFDGVLTISRPSTEAAIAKVEII